MNRVVHDLIRLHAQSPYIGAALAGLITVFFALSIDTLVIEGSSVEDMAEDNPYVQVERRISYLNSDRSLVTLIVEPFAGTISGLMGDLEKIRSAFHDQFQDGEFRSILYMKDQLFLYGLSDSDPIDDLLVAVSGQRETANLVSQDVNKFLILLWVPKNLDDRSQLSFIHDLDLDYIKKIQPLSRLHLRWDTEQSIKRDMRVLLPAVSLVILAIAGIGFGSVGVSVLLALMLTISGILILSLFSLFVVPINLITLLAIPIVLVLSLASSFHLLSFVSEYRRGAAENTVIVEKTLKRLFVPLSMSTATTVIALATFGFSAIKPIAQLGLLAATALLFMLLITILLAPLGLHWFLRTSRQTDRLGIVAILSGTLRRNRRTISIGLLTLTLGSIFSVPFLSIESDPDAFFPKNTDFSDTYLEFGRDFGRYSIVTLLLEPKGDAWNADKNQTAFADVHTIRDRIQTLDGIMRVDIDARTKVSDADTEQIETVAYLIIVFVTNKSDTERVAQQINIVLDPYRTAFNAGITNPLLVYDYFDRQASSSLLRALSVSFLVILCLFWILFRSWRVMLAALAANAVPVAALCGLIWALGTPMNILTAFVFLVALGVIVDDTIHILYYRSTKRILTGSSVEYSVLITTGASCCGFALCYLSQFDGIQQFAGYSAVAFALAVISDLTVLPYLLEKSYHSSEPAAAPT